MNKAQLEFILSGLNARIDSMNENSTEEEKTQATYDYLKSASEAMDIVDELS